MSHLIDSIMVYVHPPLAVIGYVTLILGLFLFLRNYRNPVPSTFTKSCLYFSWFFNFLGLLSGMIWAQLAWNAYWSWDPKETVSLLLFIFVSVSVLQYGKRKKVAFFFLVLALVSIMINIAITIGSFGLHSYNL